MKITTFKRTKRDQHAIPPRCERCGRFIRFHLTTLEYDQRTSTYRIPGLTPLAHSQGGFDFHPGCAERELKKHFQRKAKR